MAYAFFERGHTAVVTEGLRNADVVSIRGKWAYEFEIKVSKSDLDRELAAIEYANKVAAGAELGPAVEGSKQEQINLELAGLKLKAGGYSKVSKHEEYIDPKGYFEKHKRYMFQKSYIPNYFYLVVPDKLSKYAIEKTENTGYGIIAYDGCRSEGKHYGYKLGEQWFERSERPEGADWLRGAPCGDNCLLGVSVKRQAKRIHSNEIDDYVIYNILSRACAENIRMMREIIVLNGWISDLKKEKINV
jgi:hypothetical protein